MTLILTTHAHAFSVPPPATNPKDRPESTFVAPQLRQTIKRAPSSGSTPAIAAKSADARPLYRVRAEYQKMGMLRGDFFFVLISLFSCQVTFEYTASNDDELSLKIGQV